MSAEVLRKTLALKYIGVLATGYNVVDLSSAREQGIVVTNIPSYGTAAVAQFTMGMILQLCHRIGEHSSAVHLGAWSLCPDFCFWDFPLIELAGKTIGLVGYGKTGRKMAQISKAFGLNVLVHSRTKPSKQDLGKYVSFEKLLQKSDIISLHCPLTNETKDLINKETIQKMKTGVFACKYGKRRFGGRRRPEGSLTQWQNCRCSFGCCFRRTHAKRQSSVGCCELYYHTPILLGRPKRLACV